MMKTNNYVTQRLTMGRLLVVCFALLLLPAAAVAQRTLVWEENFNGPVLNPQVWAYETGDGCNKGNCGWGNQELEYYTARTENVRIENGHLVIEARREDMGGKPFTSGRIKTAGRVAFRYGALEARIKVPKVGNGLWPAFWMLGATGGKWPHNGEVDILELGSRSAITAGKANKTVGAAAHWWTVNPGGYTGHAEYGRDTAIVADLSDDYHLYRLEWDASFVTVLLDNVPYYKIAISGGKGLEAFQQPFYILLNLAVGGSYTGILNTAGITAPVPGRMEIDYLKLYQDVTQNETLLFGGDNAPEGAYGIFTDNTPVNDRVAYGAGADLFLWNNITNITSPAPVPFEGSNVWAFHANSGSWFGLGVANDGKNMSNFAAGRLKFHMKTTSGAVFKVGIAADGAEGWVSFNGQNGEHGLVRDGQWHEVTIPVSEFGLQDLSLTTQLFMLSGDAPAAPVDFYLDNIYYTGGVAANPAPRVTITNLVNDTVFTTPATIPVNTNARDTNGTISKVTFYSNDNYLGTVTTAPFNYAWQTTVPGVYKLTAKATDNQNKSTTSKPVTVLVTRPNNTAPAISITSPAAATPYMKPATVNITTAITDDGGTYKVEFYNGSALLGTVYKAPFNYSWTAVDQGTYTIRAKVFDDGNKSVFSAPVTFTVKDNKILSDKYGVYTDNSLITTKLTYGVDANLFVWNNLTAVTGAAPQEGTNVMAFTAAAGNWFGLGVSNDVRDLTHFSNGYLKYWFKTTYQGAFKFSVISKNGQKDITFAAGEQKLGLLRDGQWHQVVVPVNTLTGVDLSTITQAFTFSGDAPAAAASFYIDNVYYSTLLNETSVRTNLALNKPVTVTSAENAGTPGSNAVDGNATTRWSSTFNDGPQWLTVDLGATYSIDQVKITWEAAAAKDYEVQLSADQSTWTTLKPVVDNAALVNDFTGLSGTGRYLRIYCTSRLTPYGYSVYELEAYGTATAARSGTNELPAMIPDARNTAAAAGWIAAVHPNPVAGSQLRLMSNQPVKQAAIADLAGRTWTRQNLQTGAKTQGIYTLETGPLPAGLYLLYLYNTRNQQQVIKFIKQ